MATSRKTILMLAGAALTLGACASDPYYNGYHGDRYSYGYGGGPAYYDPMYSGPTVGFGLAWDDSDGHRHRDGDRDWRGDRGDHGERGHDGSTGQNERG
jgi:hypothetical protein